MKYLVRNWNGLLLKEIMYLLFAMFIILPLQSHADDNYWTGNADNNWSNAGNWSLGYAPVEGDTVFLSPTNQNTVVIYDTSNNPRLNGVQIDGAGGSTMEVQQSQGSLTSWTDFNPLIVGYNGTAIYTQTGGQNHLSASTGLTLGYNTGSNGTYNLSGASTLYASMESIGYNGTGTFNQTGGSNQMGSHLNIGTLGIYNLSNSTGASGLAASNGEHIAGVFNQTGGTNISGWVFDVGGTYNLSGDPNQSILISETIAEYIYGTFNQAGGANKAVALDVSGVYNLSGDPAKSILTIGYSEGIGAQGSTAIFNQTGGTHIVEGILYLGASGISMGGAAPTHFEGNGTFNLSGDPTKSTLTVNGNEYIGGNGYTGVFNQTGGSHTVEGTLSISDNQASSFGIYNLNGGSLTVMNGIVNNGQLYYSGGVLTADVTNNGTFNLSGTNRMTDTLTVNGDVTNNGNMKVSNVTATYTGIFTNNGGYISDPSYNKFDNLLIGPNGYLQGSAGDQFLISKDFLNYSTSSLWNTTDALLGFDGSGLHSLYETGDFQWDTLKIFDGNALSLSGTGSLYLEHLIGIAFDPNSGNISNIWGNGLNIYLYTDDMNLLGHTFSLLGGGSLIAYNPNPTAPTPEPSTLLLMGTALIGLAGFRKKIKR